MEGLQRERRQFARQSAIRPCKIRARGSARYTAGSTSDYSAGGALLCVGAEHQLAEGDQIEFGMAWHSEAVLPDRAMRYATVRRVSPMDDQQQAVGIEFAEADARIVTRSAAAA